MSFLSSLFGTRNDRVLNKTNKVVDQAEKHLAGLRGLSDEELRAKTAFFKDKIQKGASLESLVPEALAVACLGAERALGLTPYRVQMIGAVCRCRLFCSKPRGLNTRGFCGLPTPGQRFFSPRVCKRFSNCLTRL